RKPYQRRFWRAATLAGRVHHQGTFASTMRPRSPQPAHGKRRGRRACRAAQLRLQSMSPSVQSTELHTAAHTFGLKLHVLHASADRDFDTVFATLRQLGAGGLVIGNDTFFSTRSEQLAALALRHAVPAIFQYRQFAEAGGLMSYGGNLSDNYRLT